VRHLLLSSAISLSLATAASAAPAPQESWGRAGISSAQYRQDAIDCAVEGYYLDIANTEDAKAFVTASRRLDSLPMGVSAVGTTGSGGISPSGDNSVQVAANFAATQQHIIDSIHPGERFQHIKKMQLSTSEQCLTKRGYSKFRLTDAQRHRLRKLKFGSDERRAYLYSLASNASVLQTQATVAQP
jgi:hypothetical protein